VWPTIWFWRWPGERTGGSSAHPRSFLSFSKDQISSRRERKRKKEHAMPDLAVVPASARHFCRRESLVPGRPTPRRNARAQTLARHQDAGWG
jgi:hypothetical protein